MPFCKKCGEEYPEGAFCPSCSQENIETEKLTTPQPLDKNFFGSLFDWEMKEMITPKVIKVLFILGIVGIGLMVLAAIFTSFGAATQPFGSWGSFFLTLIFAPLGGLIGVILYRVYLEIILLLFYIYDELRDIKSGLSR